MARLDLVGCVMVGLQAPSRVFSICHGGICTQLSRTLLGFSARAVVTMQLPPSGELLDCAPRH